MTVLTLFFLGTFILSGSAWLIQKPVRLLSNTRRSYGVETREAARVTKTLVVPGISLPIDELTLGAISVLSNNFKQNLYLQYFAGRALAGGNFAGQSKMNTSAFDTLQKIYVNDVVANKQNLPADYKYFGNGNTEEILKQLLLNNPFFTSALKYDAEGLTITSFTKKGSETRYSKLLKSYEKKFPRVNVKFDQKTLEVTDYTVFDGEGRDITSKHSRKEAIKLLMFTLTFYAEVIHASIHIYDYINVLGLFQATIGYSAEVTNWAATYIANVPKKYFEVEQLLFSEEGALVSPTGFYATRADVLEFVVNDLLKPWFHYGTANEFVDKFVFADLPPSQRKGFLTAFRDQVDLIPNFARDLSAAIEVTATTNYTHINDGLKYYYNALGTDISNITNVGTWIQLMSAINILHGSTFSFSRYVATPDFLPYRTTATTYNITDVSFAVTVLATTLGLAPDRYVYTSQLFREASPVAPIHQVLQLYDIESNKLKTNYLNSILADTEKFKNYGWLLTDFAPDLIDNKQLTLATYV